MTMSMLNSCIVARQYIVVLCHAYIVAKRYVVRYQQTTMFTLFKESIKYHKFCAQPLRYNILIIIENFWSSVRNMLP